MIVASTLLSEAARKLQDTGVSSPLKEARLLLGFALDIPADTLFFTDPHVPDSVAHMFFTYLERRLKEEPLAKILGKKEFWGHEFKVSKDVLDPRPDSETIIQGVLKQFPDTSVPLSILDIGTGSGCLLITLLKEYPNARGVGVDISLSAIAIAKSNAQYLHVADRCTFVVSSWGDAVSCPFDVIISNPPYIGFEESLPVCVKDFDPHIALFSEKNGLASYEEISLRCKEVFLQSHHSRAFFEIGHTQKAQVEHIFKAYHITLDDVIKDLGGIDRCLVFKKL